MYNDFINLINDFSRHDHKLQHNNPIPTGKNVTNCTLQLKTSNVSQNFGNVDKFSKSRGSTDTKID